MEHAFTPGPWHWTWDGEGQPGRIGVSLPSIGGGYDSHCIALTQPGKFDVRANARLIAAAPELLEALRSFIYEFGDKTNSATVNKARAALSKALGEQQA